MFCMVIGNLQCNCYYPQQNWLSSYLHSALSIPFQINTEMLIYIRNADSQAIKYRLLFTRGSLVPVEVNEFSSG